MSRSPRLAAPMLLLALAACQSDTSTAPAPYTAPIQAAAVDGIPNRYIIVFNKNVIDVDGKTKDKVLKHAGKLKFAYKHAVKGFAAELSDAAVAQLSKDPDVALIEQDQVVTAFGGGTLSPAAWGLDRLNQRALPLDNTYSWTSSGAGVTAYIIDTGIYTAHAEFAGRASIGFDAVGDGQNGNDCNGHGTHVSGTVAGKTYGVAKDARLVGVRVLDCNGSGTYSGVIAGVDWVAANHVSPAVANMSLGGGASQAVDDAVQGAINSGVTFGVAAGNGNSVGVGVDACTTSPARLAAAITVSATDNTDTKAIWANYGSCVDLFAPGVSITSAWNTGTTALNIISGTSMATPHVVGVAALYLELNPASTPQQVRDAIVTFTTKGVVKSGGSTTPNNLLYSIVNGSAPPPPPPPPAPTISLTVSKRTTFFGPRYADLRWTGATGTNIDVYRNNVRLGYTTNDGAWSDNLGRSSGTFTYKVCLQNTSTCSNNASVSY